VSHRVIIASFDPVRAEILVTGSGNAAIRADRPARLEKIDARKADCLVIHAGSYVELEEWLRHAGGISEALPWIAVSDSEEVIDSAIDLGASDVIFESSLALLPFSIKKVLKLEALHPKQRSAKPLEEDPAGLVEHVIDVITVLDIKGNITYESPSVKRALGYEQPELVGRNAFSLIHPLDVPRVLPVFMLGVATPNSPLAAKFRFKHADGSWAYLESLGKSVYTSEGVRILVASRIVTEKAHLTTLGQTETRFMNVVEGLGEGLFIINKQDCIDYANSRMTQLTGYSQEELIGREAKMALLEETGWAAFEECRARTLTGKSEEFEFEMHRKNGVSFWAHMHLTPYVDHEGVIIGTLAAVTNVTERKIAERKLEEARGQLEAQVEELRRAKVKAEEMSQLKSAFLANMSHEIRTPMNSILGFASVLREQLESATDEESKESAEFALMIESSGKRLLSTINGILDLARIESDKMEIRPKWILLPEEVGQVVSSLKPLAKQKGLERRYRPSPRLTNVDVFADNEAISHVLNNLIGNAIKFTEYGFVEVMLELEHSHEVGKGVASGVTIYVMDSGVGISEEFIPHIFDEFKQESSGWARNFEGTGLGLTITKKLIDLMGGEITVTSSRGKGATFKVWLPCEIRKHETEEQAEFATA
jgi:PAS domain S-box-containing protein